MLAHSIRNLTRTEPGRLITGAGALFACRVSGAVIAYLTLILLARWMGANELGTYVFAYSWCITLTMVATLGYPGAAFRFIGLGLTTANFGLIRGFVRRGRQIILASSLLVTCGGSVILLAAGDFIAQSQRLPFLIALACVPIFGLSRLNTVISHAFSWFALAIAPNSLIRPLLLIIAVTAIWLAGTDLSASLVLWLFMGSLVVITVTQHWILAGRLRQKLGDARPVYQTGTWVRTGLPLLFISAFSTFFPEVSVTIAGIYLPAEELAKLNAGIRTAFLIAFGLEAVDNILAPRIAILFAKGNSRELQRIVTGTTHLKFWSALAAIVIFAFFGKEILGLFGTGFRDGFSALIIFSIALLVRAGAGPVTQLLSVTGHQNNCIPVYCWSLPLHLLLTAVLIPRFGIAGAAIAMLATTVFWTLWLHAVVVRRLGVRPSIFARIGSGSRLPVE